MNIYPTILTDQQSLVQQQLEICQDSGLVQTVQIDVIDGYFKDNITVAPSDLVGMEFGDLQLDFHLMTQEPIDFVREIIDHQEELPVRSVIGQVEQMTSQELFVDEVRRYGWNVGLSLDLYTPLSAIESRLWDRLNCVQLLAVEAGAQGQEFNEVIYEKLESLQKLLAGRDIRLEVIVDGGVGAHNIAKLQEHSVASVGIGSSLWKAPDFVEAFQNIESEVV